MNSTGSVPDSARIEPAEGEALKRAACYVRMSTDTQKLSIEVQAHAIAEHAAKAGLEIVRTYADHGRSGLRLDGRKALQSLLADIEGGRADFQTVLVYDVSRWGRFQDPDEAAHYELRCRQAGVHIEYCAEPFENDGSMTSVIVKAIKRSMAGEYSRELSVKIYASQSRLATRGYALGGPAPFGLRRLLLDENGVAREVLKPRQRKSIQSDRVVFVPGPPKEVELVRTIFAKFVGGMSVSKLRRLLNNEWPREDGRTWSRYLVTAVLKNEIYLGRNIWARTSYRLGAKKIYNHPDHWIRSEQIFEPFISQETFTKAQARFSDYHKPFDTKKSLVTLRRIFEKHGRLDASIIDATPRAPSSIWYKKRFGSLNDAYEAVGYVSPYRTRGFTSREKKVLFNIVQTKLRAIVESCHSSIAIKGRMITINGELRVACSIMLPRDHKGKIVWDHRADNLPAHDLHLWVRAGRESGQIADFYLFPAGRVPFATGIVESRLAGSAEQYRTPDLTIFSRLASRLVFGTIDG